MLDDVIVQNSPHSYRHLTAALIITVVSLSLSVWIGYGLPSADSGGIVSLASPFENGFASGAVALCFWEIAPLAVFAFSGGYLFRSVFAAAVFFVRGAAIGASIVFCVENISGTGVLGIIISYASVTLLGAVFYIIMTVRNDLGLLYRLLAYMSAAGAAAILRILPYLLLL